MPKTFARKAKRNKDGISRARDDDAPVEPPPKRIKPSLPEPVLDEDSAVVESEWPVLDPDAKAYWIQINDKIIELENVGVGMEEVDEDEDERKLLLRTALGNLSQHELALATDPETSVILERLLHTMDDFARRVMADRFTGLYAKLAQHQFASHVVETLFTLGSQTVDRETKGKIASGPADQPDAGLLPTMTDLLVSATAELQSSVPDLLCHIYGSHVVRAALCFLSGRPVESKQSSKKSQKFKRGQAPMKSLFGGEADDKGKARSLEVPTTAQFKSAFLGFVEAIDVALGKDQDGSEARRVAGDDVGTLVVQLVLQIEADLGVGDKPDSILDRLLQGLVTSLHTESDTPSSERSDFLEAMLRSPSTSHTFEVVLSPAISNDALFKAVWKAYFQERIAKMAAHPVANFVFSAAVHRLDAQALEATLKVFLSEKAGKTLLETARTGPLQALIDRSAALNAGGEILVQVLKEAFELQEPSAMALQAVLKLSRASILAKSPHAAFSTQGSFLAQSWLRLPAAYHRFLVDSLLKTTPAALVEIAKSQTTCPVFETALSSPSVTGKDKRALMLKFLGHYHTLADDRNASRAADACWAAADVYLKDKIAVSLAEQQDFLLSSRFGSFFLKKLFLPLHQRKNEEWRIKIASMPQRPGRT